ncbi:MAG: hypothetical protein U0263_04365 [Polyangiaceae bacterium]
MSRASPSILFLCVANSAAKVSIAKAWRMLFGRRRADLGTGSAFVVNPTPSK